MTYTREHFDEALAQGKGQLIRTFDQHGRPVVVLGVDEAELHALARPKAMAAHLVDWPEWAKLADAFEAEKSDQGASVSDTLRKLAGRLEELRRFDRLDPATLSEIRIDAPLAYLDARDDDLAKKAKLEIVSLHDRIADIIRVRKTSESNNWSKTD